VPESNIQETERPTVALTQVKLPYTSLKIEKYITLDEPPYLPENIVVDFPGTKEAVKLVPWVKADLPFTLTRKTAIWIESERPEASTYHLQHPYYDKSFPAIKYINNQWYYLDWNKGKYYTRPLSYISTPISLGLGTFQTLVIDILHEKWEPVQTLSVSDSTGRQSNTVEGEDELVSSASQI